MENLILKVLFALVDNNKIRYFEDHTSLAPGIWKVKQKAEHFSDF